MSEDYETDRKNREAEREKYTALGREGTLASIGMPDRPGVVFYVNQTGTGVTYFVNYGPELKVYAGATRYGNYRYNREDIAWLHEVAEKLGGRLAFNTLDLDPDSPSREELNSLDLSGLNLRGTIFNRVRMYGVSVKGADISGTSWDDVSLAGVDFTGATADGADLRKANEIEMVKNPDGTSRALQKALLTPEQRYTLNTAAAIQRKEALEDSTIAYSKTMGEIAMSAAEWTLVAGMIQSNDLRAIDKLLTQMREKPSGVAERDYRAIVLEAVKLDRPDVISLLDERLVLSQKSIARAIGMLSSQSTAIDERLIAALIVGAAGDDDQVRTLATLSKDKGTLNGALLRVAQNQWSGKTIAVLVDEFGANPNVQRESDGKTPLMLSAERFFEFNAPGDLFASTLATSAREGLLRGPFGSLISRSDFSVRDAKGMSVEDNIRALGLVKEPWAADSKYLLGRIASETARRETTSTGPKAGKVARA